MASRHDRARSKARRLLDLLETDRWREAHAVAANLFGDLGQIVRFDRGESASKSKSVDPTTVPDRHTAPEATPPISNDLPPVD